MTQENQKINIRLKYNYCIHIGINNKFNNNGSEHTKIHTGDKNGYMRNE